MLLLLRVFEIPFLREELPEGERAHEVESVKNSGSGRHLNIPRGYAARARSFTANEILSALH